MKFLEFLKYLEFGVMGIVRRVAPWLYERQIGSQPPQDIPVFVFGIILFKFSQHEDSNYKY